MDCYWSMAQGLETSALAPLSKRSLPLRHSSGDILEPPMRKQNCSNGNRDGARNPSHPASHQSFSPPPYCHRGFLKCLYYRILELLKAQFRKLLSVPKDIDLVCCCYQQDHWNNEDFERDVLEIKYFLNWLICHSLLCYIVLVAMSQKWQNITKRGQLK